MIGKVLDQSGISRLDGDVPNRSAKFLLVETRLGSDLAEFIRERRPATSYENIARELWSTTGVNVTSQTVANWADPSPTQVAS